MTSGLKFIPSFLNVSGLIVTIKLTAEKDEAIISDIYLWLPYGIGQAIYISIL